MASRLAQARNFRFPIPLFRGVAKAALYCAHRTSTFLSCAICEQEGHLAAPLPALFDSPQTFCYAPRRFWTCYDKRDLPS